MIPDEAVEVAAKAIFISTGQFGVAWCDLDGWVQDRFRVDARAALEAAAPHLKCSHE